MIIDNLTATNMYFEKKVLINITCNSEQNSDGRIVVDDLGNSLVNIVDSGDTNLYRLKSSTKRIMFYNETDKRIRIVSEGELIDMPLDFSKGTRYFLDSRREYGFYRGDYMFEVTNLSEYEVFKIFLDDGREITSYDIEGNNVILKGVDRLYIDSFSEIIVYLYKSTSLRNPTSMSVDRNEDNSSSLLNYSENGISFVLEYYNYENIIDIESFIDGSYFETFVGNETNCFESLEISQSVTKDSEKRNFSNVARSRINSVDNSVDLNLFNGSDEVDLIQYIGRDEFRIVLVNPVFGRIVIINNCYIINGISLIYEKEKNYKKVALTCGNYIDINVSNPSEYGMGRYGRGQYGTGTQIFNSSRRGGLA